MEKEKKYNYFTSEWVGIGHPDKLADYISDKIMYSLQYNREDPNLKTGIETFLSSEKLIVVGGEVDCELSDDDKDELKGSVEWCLYEYFNEVLSPDFEGDIIIDIKGQSPEIKNKVENEKETGAGDQGIMFGWASRETDEMLGLELVASRELGQWWQEHTEAPCHCHYYVNDIKTQITTARNLETNEIEYIDTVVISYETGIIGNKPEHHEYIKYYLKNEFRFKDLITDDTNIYINNGGTFDLSSFYADSGLTGRKIIVDTYGGRAPHGGGAFSGKDLTKVDRSAAYIARYLAVDVLKNDERAKDSKECLVQLSYVIGKAQPLSINVKLDNVERPDIANDLMIKYDLSVDGMINLINKLWNEIRQNPKYNYRLCEPEGNESDNVIPFYEADERGGHFGNFVDLVK